MDEADARMSRRLVRMYSDELENRLPPTSDAYALGQVLIKDRSDSRNITNPWQVFLRPSEEAEKDDNPITRVVAVESAKLREKWLAFQNACPPEERLDLQKYEPTIEGVVDLVGAVNTSWQGKRANNRRGAAMMSFHRFCDSLNSHSAMIKLLPEGNEYTSVFTGTLNTVIQASVNHERIVQSFSESLCLISEHIVECKPELELFRTDEMLRMVADLYAHIFLYLSSVMDWLMRKRRQRLLDSFKEDFSQKFSVEITKIQHLGERIRNLSAQNSRIELRALGSDWRAGIGVVGDRMTHMERDIRIGQEGQARHQADMAYYAAALERELVEARKEREHDRKAQQLLLTRLTDMLQGGAMTWLQSPGSMSTAQQLLEGLPILTPALSWAPGHNTLSEVASSSKHLEDFFHRDRVHLGGHEFYPAMVSQQTLSRLREWVAGTGPQMLWFDGPTVEMDDLQNPLTSMAAKFVDLADTSGVRTISYFCELRRGEKRQPGNSREMQGLIALLYALVRQQIELLLPIFETTIDLSDRRFAGFDGTSESIQDGMSLFSELLDLMPDTMYCVIDGLHWLDDPSTDASLEALLDVLRHKKLRVLFTTSGRSKCLREKLTVEETLVESAWSQDVDVEELEVT